MRKPRSNVPFKYFKVADDITLCKNKYCSIRFTCQRHMLAPSEWQSFTMYEEGPMGCEHHLPYYVWTDAIGKQYLLKEIEHGHLLNIIQHLKDRIKFINDAIKKSTDYEEKKVLTFDKKRNQRLMDEFKKEAVKRKLIKKTVKRKLK